MNKANEAQMLLSHPQLKDAFNSVRDHIIKKGLMFAGQPGEAWKIVTSLQLLEGIIRELQSHIETQQVNDFIEEHKIKEEQAKNKVLEFNRGY